jgi:kynurenine formamidase
MKKLKILSVAGAFFLALNLTGNAHAASECIPSKYGKDDQIGAANLITTASVAAAAKLVVKGETHPLGIVIDPNMPAFPPRKMMLQVVQPNQQFGRSMAGDFGWDIVYNDDVTQLWWGTGPQIDGLGHLGESGMFYNCNKGKEFAALTGLKKLGIHTIPPIVARGVMIDMAKHFGVTTMEAGQHFDSSDIKTAAKNQGVIIKAGDVVLFHTGWTDGKLASAPKSWVSGEPGLSNEAAEYLATLNPIAVGADTWGIEAVPPKKGDKVFYGHVTFLKMNGIYSLETLTTGRLAKEGVNEFMFVLGQARLKGAVQMIINPVAMW